MKVPSCYWVINLFKNEYRFIRADGSVVWIDADLSIDVIEGETIALGSVRDITDRKNAEQALLEQERFLSSVADTSPAIVYIDDMETRSNVYTGKGIQRTLGMCIKGSRH